MIEFHKKIYLKSLGDASRGRRWRLGEEDTLVHNPVDFHRYDEGRPRTPTVSPGVDFYVSSRHCRNGSGSIRLLQRDSFGWRGRTVIVVIAVPLPLVVIVMAPFVTVSLQSLADFFFGLRK